MSRVALTRAAIWVLALSPAGSLAWRAASGNLGANPIEEVTHQTGWWALFILLASLSVTPLRRLTGWHRVIRYRRLIGLFAFFYATLHFLTYLVLDQFFAFAYILEDIAERPFITSGFAAWMLLLALAVTSTRRWIRRLGRKWQRLHRLVYLAATLGGIHFFWNVKADTREPLIFLSVLAVLLALRLPVLLRARSRRPTVNPSANRTAGPSARPSVES